MFSNIKDSKENKENEKEKANNFTEGIIDIDASNISKIEIKNTSINSSCKSVSRFEEQKEMLQLLDNKLNLDVNYLFFNKYLIVLFFIESKSIINSKKQWLKRK